MTINFTEEEKEYIDKQPFNWKVAEDCPKEIRKGLEEKLSILNGKTYDYNKRR